MKHLIKYIRTISLLALVVIAVGSAGVATVYADPMRRVTCNDNKTISVPGSDTRSDQEICKSNGGAKVVPSASSDGPQCALLPAVICTHAKDSADIHSTGVFLLLIWVLNIMTAGVGIAAVGALVYAGILYASAGGGSDQIVKSKKIITDTVIGIVAYALMYLVINWLVPGGVIG